VGRKSRPVLALDRRRFLVAYGVDPARWARRHDIEPAEAPCQVCGAPLRTTLPFAAGEFRGLLAPPCGACGNEITPYCLVRDARFGDLLGP
jgi:hypothetical protein